MVEIKQSTLTLLLASSLLLSGCEMSSAQEYEETENFSADFGATESGSVIKDTTETQLDKNSYKQVNPKSTKSHLESVIISEISYTIDAESATATVKGDLYNNPFSLNQFGDLTEIKTLNILNYNEGGAVAKVDFNELKDLNIENISLCSVKFLDDDYWGFDNLSKLKYLKKISFENCYQVNNWKFLNLFTDIESVSFEVCNINNADFINEMTSLKSLNLNHTEIRNFDLLKDNSSIENLNCVENKIEDIRGLRHLGNLKTLFISEAYYNNHYNEFMRQYTKLSQDLPECSIEYIVMSDEK